MSSEYKRIRDYELMVVFHPELSEEDLTAEVAKVEGHVTAQDGTIRLINREMPWGRRRLAYPIRHGSRDVRDGVYVLYYFTSESGRIEEIEREVKLDDRILRYLLTQQSAPMMEPTPVEEEGAEQVEMDAEAQADQSAVAPAAAAELKSADVPVEVETAMAKAPLADDAPVAEAPPTDETAISEAPAIDDETAAEEVAKSAEPAAVETK
jgi:small subunit ribosomal protein S6